MLTGTGLRVNTDAAADDFGASITFPRGLASDGTTCILFSASAGYELNVETGIATRIGSVADFLINEGQLRGATYQDHTDQFVFWGNSENRFYAYNAQNGIAANLGLQFASAWDFWALASLNGVLYAIDRGEDALYIIDPSAGTATRVGTADAFGIGTGNVQSLCVYDGRLYAFSATLDRLILIDETDGTASIVNDMDLPDGSPEAAVEHGGNLYYAGSSDDALFRMYDVLWDETIANPEIDEGDSGTLLDLSTVSQDAETYALQGTNPAWVSVSGNNLVATNAPDVAADTDYDVGGRATRDGVNVDTTIQVTVRFVAPPNTAPTFAESSYAFTDIAIAIGTGVGTITATDADNDPLTYSLTGANASQFAISASGEITAAEALDHDTLYIFSIVADDGTDTASVAASVRTFIELNLTGTGVSLGTSQFGVSESYARAAASDGTTAYNFGRTQGYTLNVSTGASIASGSVWSGSGQIRSATYHNSQVLVYIDSRNIHVFTPGTGFGSTALISNLRYATGSGFSGTPSINGFASHQGVLYVTDDNENHLFSVGSDGVLTAVGSGYGNRNIGGLTSHEGRLLATNNTNDRLVQFDTADGTVTNVANNGLLGNRSIDFLLSHDTELYGGQFSDGLLRFYNVLWDETIAGFEVDEGTDTTWSLSDISRDAASFSLQGSPPSWLSTSGTDLVATNAPQVDADTDYDVTGRAIRDGVNVDQPLRIVVRNTGAPPPPNTAPSFDQASYTVDDVAIAVNSVVDTITATDADNDALSYSLTGTDASKFNIDSVGEITVAELLEYGESYAVNVVANDGTDTASVSVTITAETVSPRAPTIVVDSVTQDSATITITPGDDGGAAVTDWEYELDSDGTWNSFGNTDLQQMISGLSAGTAYSVKVRGVNSEGNGLASAAVSITTDAAVSPLSFGSATIANQSWVVGTSVTTLTLPEATGGTGTKTYSLSPTLPTGMVFRTSTRRLSGTPTAAFVSATFTYTAEDEDGNTVELTFMVAVALAPPSLHNTFIFKECVNYRNNGARASEHGHAPNIIRAVADNNRETFSTETDYAIDIEVDSAPTRVDAFYLVSKGVDTHTGTPTGGSGSGWTARTLPASVENIRGESVSTVVDGLQHDLYLLPAHFTATSVRLQFTGTGIEIYEIMLLEIVQEINATYSDFLGYAAEQANRTGRVERSPVGRLSVVDSTREKRDVEMTIYIRPGGTTLIQSPDEFLYLLEANTRLTLAEGFSENPSFLYPAIVGSLEIPVPYHSTYKPLGYDVPVLVRER